MSEALADIINKVNSLAQWGRQSPVRDSPTELVQAAYDIGKKEGWRAGYDEAIEVVKSEWP